MMKRYFKHYAESEWGVGICFVELTDEWPTRQVEIYGLKWLWGDKDHQHNLGDRPIDVSKIDERDLISAEEFETIWENARARVPDS